MKPVTYSNLSVSEENKAICKKEQKQKDFVNLCLCGLLLYSKIEIFSNKIDWISM